MLKLKLQYFGHLMWRADSLEKTLMRGKIGDKRMELGAEDEIIRYHHQLNGHEFEQTLGDSEGQGSLVCCGPWSLRVGDDLATEQQWKQQHGCIDTYRDDRFFAFFCDYCELRKAWPILCISVLFAFQLFPAIASSICYFSYSVQLVQFSCSVMSNSLWPRGLQDARPPCPSPTPRVYWSSCPSSQWYHYNHLILCHPLLLLPSIFLSIRFFSKELVLRIRWPKYWSFSFTISPSNEYSGLISFRMDWLDLLAVQQTFKSLFQHRVQKHQFFWCSAFFIFQLSHPYITTGKTIALTRWTFVGKVMSAF